MPSHPSEKRTLSLAQARQLYKFNFMNIEPIAMQEGLVSSEFPSNQWVVAALKVGYGIFLNASKQKRIYAPPLPSKSSPQRDETIFLSSILINTIKVFGLKQFLSLLWILLKNLPSLLKIVLKVIQWKGAPPTVDDLETVLVTPLGADLAEEFREQGSLGISTAFQNFFEIQDRAKLKKLKADLARAQKPLSDSEIQIDNREAIAASRQALSEKTENHHFSSLTEFRELFVTLPLPAIADTFQEDEIFAYMRVAGPNPVMLERVQADSSAIFQKFPVSDDQYRAVMGDHDDLHRAGTEGRLYAVDYGMLEGALLGTFGPTPEEQKYLYPAMALFAVPDQSHDERYLRPIAIQCGQDPNRHPILTPASGKYPWLAAKSAIQVADSTIHEAISHLGCTHLFVDPFVVSTHRQLPESHCVYRLLRPHFEGTILINYGAWKLLTAKGQAVNSLLPPTIAQARTVAVQGLRQLGFNDQMLPKRLEARGVMDTNSFPLYPYRDDGLAIWSALQDWVKAYIHLNYDSDQAVVQDEALQNWAKELVALDGGRVQKFGNDGEGSVTTRDYLIEALTLVIFTGSAQHAAVNFPQKGIMSFAPAMPMSGYCPGEDIPKIQSEADWCRMLPPEDQAKQQLQILQILGGVNYTNLGEYREAEKQQLGQEALPALEKFHDRLKEIEQSITDRNNKLPEKFEYNYLKPSNIPQSINI